MRLFQIKPNKLARLFGIVVMALLVVIVISLASPAASSKAVYTIDRSSLHSYGSSQGCDASEKSNFTLNGTKGQPEVEPELSEADLSLRGGFGANQQVPSDLDCETTPVPTETPSPTATATANPDPSVTPVPTGTPDDPVIFDTSIYLPIIER